MDDKIRISVPNPFEKANIFSKVFVCYISPLLKLGKKRPIEEEDLPDTCKGEESSFLTKNLENEWNKELKKKKPSLFKCIVRVFWLKIFLSSFLIFIEVRFDLFI